MTLIIKDLEMRIKRNTILKDLNLELDDGIYGLLGPNGAGKTTLIRCITGIYKANGGSIVLDEKLKPQEGKFADSIGYLPQQFGLFKDMKVYDMMMYLAGLKDMDEKTAKEQILEALEKVKLADKKNAKVKTLSGGMIRRLGIAQALLGNTRLLIFDEPTAGLDPEERMRFKSIIEELSRDKIVIISTHILSDVEEICDKVILINEGRILFNDTVEALKAKGDGKMMEEGYLCVLKEQ